MSHASLFLSLCIVAVPALASGAAHAADLDARLVDPARATADFGDDALWYDALDIGVEGRGWTDTQSPYDRFPARAEGVIPGPVWGLSRDSAGMAVRFCTDSPFIHARWILRDSGLSMPHMPATGVSGLDLYVNDAGVWRWIGAGRPEAFPENKKQLAADIPAGMHEFIVYLPLYNGVESVHIGIAPDARMLLPPPRPAERAKPIVIWGTSITQGGCAARPGMAYPAILGRKLHRETLNFGFSGNGKMDPEVANFLVELDPAAFVIDCCPNMSPELITERTEPLVALIRSVRPDTPLVLVENIRYQAGPFLPGARERTETKNAALRAVFDKLIAAGIPGLHYIPCDDLLGHDGEATVDGTHATDLGFLRMAEAMEPFLAAILER